MLFGTTIAVVCIFSALSSLASTEGGLGVRLD